MKNLLFLIGRIRAKESSLLKEADWQRFNEAQGLTSWLNQLQDTPYSEAATANTFEEFETKLNQHLVELKKDLFSEHHFPFDPLLWKKYDFHNFKILLKMKLGHKDLRRYVVPLGELSEEVLEEFLIKNEKVHLPLKIRRILREAEEIFKKNNDFSEMDIYLDQVYFKEIITKANWWGKEIADFFRYQIDTANFKIWWYLKKNDKAVMEYLTGGYLPARFFETAKEVAAEDMLKKIIPDKKSESLEEALLQKEMDDKLSQHLYLKRYPNKCIIPILVFFRAKEMEVKNLKTFYLRQAKDLKRLSDYLRAAYV